MGGGAAISRLLFNLEKGHLLSASTYLIQNILYVCTAVAATVEKSNKRGHFSVTPFLYFYKLKVKTICNCFLTLFRIPQDKVCIPEVSYLLILLMMGRPGGPSVYW